MEDNNKKKQEQEALKRQISILRSGNSKAIIEVIKEIRKNGQLAILPEVFELLLSHIDNEIGKECIKLLNDLKLKEAQEFMIDAIRDEKYSDIQSHLVSSCWQSGMDYHEHVLLFAEVFIKGDYMAAVESFTVIENCLGYLDTDTTSKLIDKLSKATNTIQKEKSPLLEELLMVIRRF